MGALWHEIKNWRRSEHWDSRKFFQALILGLAFTLLDTGTDLVFARSVPDECPDSRFSAMAKNITSICQKEVNGSQQFQRMGIEVQNHCGFIPSKSIKLSTYTFIALPGIMLSFSALHSLTRGLWKRNCGGAKVPGWLQAVLNAAALFLQMSICTGLVLVLMMNIGALKVCIPILKPILDGHENFIIAMAYFSAAFLVGVKILGTICHGPEVARLVEKATVAEVQYEAALQLILLGTIYLFSGKGSFESRNSAITSLLVIGKVGIQDFFKKHDKDLSKASLLGKIYIAISVSPVFILTALFKVGSIAIVFTSDYRSLLTLFLLPPALAIFLIKMCLPLENLDAASISQGVFASAVSLHLWPGEQVGKIIMISAITYSHLLYSSFLAMVIHLNNNILDIDNINNRSQRIRNGAILCLVIGWVSLPFMVCLVLFQEHYVAHVVSHNLKDREEEENIEEGQEVKPEALKGDDHREGKTNEGGDGEKETIEFVRNLTDEKNAVTTESDDRQ